MKALIYESELENIGRHAADYPILETGGDLFGFWTHSGFPVIHIASGPGTLARRSATSFYQDAAHLHRIGDALRHYHGLQHIGEWHSHHRLGLDHPSAGDAQTVIRALEETDLDRFFLTIITLQSVEGRDTPTAHGYLFQRRAGARPTPCPWVVLPGESPFRRDARLTEVLHTAPPYSKPIRCVPKPTTTLDAPASAAIPLRPGSWATAPGGVALFKAIQAHLSALGDVRFRVTSDGLVEAHWHTDDLGWALAWSNDTSSAHAVATLRWTDDDESGDSTLRGSLATVLAGVATEVDRVAEERALTLGITDDTEIQLTPEVPHPQPQPLRNSLIQRFTAWRVRARNAIGTVRSSWAPPSHDRETR